MSLKMPANEEESKIFTPFLPSLLHFSSVKVGVLLHENFSSENLSFIIKRIQIGKLITPPKKYKDLSLKNCERQHLNQQRDFTKDAYRMKEYRAQELFLQIPSHLRKNLLETVHGLECAKRRFPLPVMRTDFQIRDFSGKFTYHMRSDGTIDGIKTIQEYIKNENNDIRERFLLACFYCFVDDIQTLFVEIKASGITGELKSHQNSVVRFWVRWMIETPRVPWKQAATDFFSHLRYFSLNSYDYPRFCVLFPLLAPVERMKLLNLISHNPCAEDLLVCMYVMTKDEEKQTLCTPNTFQLLKSYLCWPMRSEFIETAKKMWNYMDHYCFYNLLICILMMQDMDKDFDYWELFEEFWESSPAYLREKVRENKLDNLEIGSWFAAMRRVRRRNRNKGFAGGKTYK